MYTSFHIQNFRCFEDLKIEPLARVNLICGKNNAGKTALLEALWVHTHPTRPRQALQIEQARGLPRMGATAPFADIFLNYQPQSTINLAAMGHWDEESRSLDITPVRRRPETYSPWPALSEDGEEPELFSDSEDEYELRFEYFDGPEDIPLNANVWAYQDASGQLQIREDSSPRPPIAARSQFEFASRRPIRPDLASRLGKAELEGYLPYFEDMLRILEPRLKGLTTIVNNDGIPHIYARLGNDLRLPIAAMGEGTGRLLSMALRFPYAKDGIILIDEIENGLHHSVLVNVWKSLDWLSRKFNVQIFATTHSYECIGAANNAFTELESDALHLHRLRRDEDHIKAVTYTKEALDTNIEYLWELR